MLYSNCNFNFRGMQFFLIKSTISTISKRNSIDQDLQFEQVENYKSEILPYINCNFNNYVLQFQKLMTILAIQKSTIIKID